MAGKIPETAPAVVGAGGAAAARTRRLLHRLAIIVVTESLSDIHAAAKQNFGPIRRSVLCEVLAAKPKIGCKQEDIYRSGVQLWM